MTDITLACSSRDALDSLVKGLSPIQHASVRSLVRYCRLSGHMELLKAACIALQSNAASWMPLLPLHTAPRCLSLSHSQRAFGNTESEMAEEQL